MSSASSDFNDLLAVRYDTAQPSEAGGGIPAFQLRFVAAVDDSHTILCRSQVDTLENEGVYALLEQLKIAARTSVSGIVKFYTSFYHSWDEEADPLTYVRLTVELPETMDDESVLLLDDELLDTIAADDDPVVRGSVVVAFRKRRDVNNAS